MNKFMSRPEDFYDPADGVPRTLPDLLTHLGVADATEPVRTDAIRAWLDEHTPTGQLRVDLVLLGYDTSSHPHTPH